MVGCHEVGVPKEGVRKVEISARYARPVRLWVREVGIRKEGVRKVGCHEVGVPMEGVRKVALPLLRQGGEDPTVGRAQLTDVRVRMTKRFFCRFAFLGGVSCVGVSL